MLPPTWICYNGLELSLGEMSDEHIRHAADYLRLMEGLHGSKIRLGCSWFSNREWQMLFAAELSRRRGCSRFPRGKR